MKTKLLLIASLAAVALSGCKDEIIQVDPSEYDGKEVVFGASLSPETRTHYGDLNTATNAYPIYWNKGNNLDKIFIYSPDAMAGRQSAQYTVNPDSVNQKTASKINKIGDVGVQWGTAQTNSFYGFYPASKNLTVSGNTTITATLPSNQQVLFTQAENTNTSTVYEGTPDMENCMMIARTAGVALGTEGVTLKFEPFSSVLDITIDGADGINFMIPEGDTLNRNWARVTSIEITADKQICGTFTYDYESGAVTANSTAEADRMIRIDTRRTNADGALAGIRLYNDQKLKVKAFLIPNELDKANITVTVHTADNAVWSQKLNTASWKDKQINPAKLAKLKFANAKFDYSVWMSQLDPRIKVSELSLPGSCMSYSRILTGDNQVQTGTIEEQYNAGIRVFQCHADLDENEIGADGKPGKIRIKSGGTVVENTYLFKEIENLCKFMADAHSNEYCVIIVSDYVENSTADNYQNLKKFYARMKDLSVHPSITPYLATNITEKTTIADIAGKVILKVQLNGVTYDISNARVTVSEGFNKVNAWSSIDNSNALLSQWVGEARDRVVYARAAFGKTGTAALTGFRNNDLNFTRLQTPEVERNQTSSPSENPSAYVVGDGIMAAAFRNIIKNTSWSSERRPGWNVRYYYYWWESPTGRNCGGSSMTTTPTDDELSKDFWYIFVEHDELSYMTTAVPKLCTAIANTYKGYNNKRYMNYVGGTSSNLTADSQSLFGIWWTNTNVEALKNKPWGWVMFNLVNTACQTYDTGDGINPIQRVINHNNDFRMSRGDAPINTKAPSGDTQGVRPGGSLF